MSDEDSGKKRIRPLHVVGLLILLGGGVYGYLELTRVSRMLDELDRWNWNPTHFARVFPELPLDDPRVTAGSVKALQTLAQFPDEDTEAYLRLVFNAFSVREPEPSPELVQSLARLYVSRGNAQCLARIAEADDAHVFEGLLQQALARLPRVAFQLRDDPTLWDADLLESHRQVWARAADELERRGYTGAAEHAEGLTQLWIRCGFPRAQTWLLAACDEDQVAQALRTELIQLGAQVDPHRLPMRKQLQVLLPELAARAPSVDDEYLEALVEAWSDSASPECAAALRGLLESHREQVLEKLHWPLLKLQVLGGTPGDVSQILDQLAEDDPDRTDGGYPGPTDYYGKASRGYRGLTVHPDNMEYFYTLVGLGPAAAPQLLEGFQRSGPSSVIATAAAALIEVDRAALVGYVQETIEGSHQLEDGKSAIARGLVALWPLSGHDVDFCYMQCLSSVDETIATYSAEALEKRLERAEFVDTLFRFLAHKGEFSWNEVITYQDALVRHDVEATVDIVRNLEQLLTEAGSPEQVFWIHKVIAIRSLKVLGDERAYPILVKYAADPGGYLHVTESGEQQTEEEIPFRLLCSEALAEIAEQTGEAAPELRGGD